MNTANCKGCYLLEPDGGCVNTISWHGGVPENPPCKMPILYQHPDGHGIIALNRDKMELMVDHERTDRVLTIKIGREGLIELAGQLITQAILLQEGSHDHE